MKRFIIGILFAAYSLLCVAQNGVLTFRKSGDLRIMQLTDLHLRTDMPKENVKVYERIRTLVDMEKPDYIVITGDVAWGSPADKILAEILGVMDSFGVPFSIVYGNHDREQDIPVEKMSKMISDAKYSINPVENGTLADMCLPVLASDGSGRESAYLYVMDSGDYSPVEGAGTYGWFRVSQVEWMRRTSAEIVERNGGKNVPALAFFHIPLIEYRSMWEDKRDDVIGTRGEAVACAAVNSGMFEAMLTGGNIFGCFCGHDHDNDFIENYCGIALGYGRYTGGNTVYNHLPAGCRMILLYEGGREFRSWIREEGGRVVNVSSYTGKTIKKLDE